jgi:hypothetical protein
MRRRLEKGSTEVVKVHTIVCSRNAFVESASAGKTTVNTAFVKAMAESLPFDRWNAKPIREPESNAPSSCRLYEAIFRFPQREYFV